MLRQDDLDIAVGRGIITPEQADELVAVASERHRARAFAVGREERFRVLGGFNDFFIAVGVVLLGCGIMFLPTTLRADYGQVQIVGGGICAVAMWALASWLTGKLRLTAPSIVIALFWVSAIAAVAIGVLRIFGIGPHGGSLGYGLIGAAALLAALAHYYRFRLPFTLALIPLAALCVALLLVETVAGGAARTEPALLSMVVFAVGAGTLLAAMRFDLSDPERLTRAADCGFWLHLVAAPMIVHPVIGRLNGHLFFDTLTRSYSPGRSVGLIVAATLILALVALAIDRRALLVAGLGYLGAAIAYLITQAGASSGLASIGSLLFLGSTIILLGTGWRPLRAGLMRALPDFPLKSRLPPYIGSS